ncbi:conserved hypothetical protein [Leishmania mexicana MHOM/GT/2001/U1103]|uniref:Uncharacterized protein n=1 Tax=Leishmania mexicana (strain MHOM/GT/2001/U1103) TaxID=929439 RepID=E9ATJ4_LEIMU|nr:conserved hypothetical protein [Leishmania mexicana MHOM/GT/2001/U1103]CBZ26268.1 conserved hypothetical protein [Leishmania mexicana MHOM/GT/2001/U1103]
MSFRAILRHLARPTAHGCAQAAPLSSSPKKDQQQMAPLLQFPQFHPIPFPQDKFLSIKSRSLETYTKVRGDVLQRCADLCAQLQRRQKQAGQSGRETASVAGPVGEEASASPAAGISPELPAHPLTPHQAEELLLLTKKVEDLVHYQGFLLTDELVWRMFHLCIQCGAPQLAVDGWLQKHVIAEKRGPPFPLFILEDLAATLRASLLPRLPESGACLTCSSVLLAASAGSADENFSIAFEDGLAAAQRFLRRHLLHAGWPTSDAVTTELLSAAQTYTAHLLAEHVWPVWQALEAMNLTFTDLRAKNIEDEEEQEAANDERGSEKKPDGCSSHMSEGEQGRCAAWLPDAATQTVAVRTALMSVTPLYSFYAPPSSAPPPSVAEGQRDSSKSAKTASTRAHALLCNDPPFFPNETAAIVAPLRALLDTWLVLAQCAAEAKDVPLLKALLRTVCLGFLARPAATSGDERDAGETEDGAQLSPVCVNEDAWCQYAAPDTEQTKDAAHQRAAELQARAMVREFVNGSLSVLQYGLLCAEQEAALWQLHDTFALISAVAASLRNLQGPQKKRGSHSATADDARLHRMSAVSLAQPAPAEEADCLLRLALPCALVSSFARGQHAAGDEEHASATAAMYAFVCDALAHPAETTAHPYAEAGLYAALATGDEALLTQTVTADMARNNSGATLHLLHARALHAYRRAATRLATTHEGGEEKAPEDDAWDAWTATLRQKVSQATSGSGDADIPQAQLVETCLTVLTLGVARRQAQGAAAYVQCVQQLTATSVAEEGDDTQDDGHNSYGNAEAEKQRREAIKVGWAQLYDGATACAQDMLNLVEQLLDASSSADATASCLSPLSLSTLAVLTRVGIYVEEEAQARAASASTTSEDLSKPAGVSPSPLPLTISLDRVVARVVRDTCIHLRCASTASPTGVAPTATSSVVGNWVQWVLLTLMARRAWTDVLAVLRALDGEASGGGSAANAAGTSSTLLCSTTVDPSVFAALYARAMEDGAASVCAFLRPRRERLFF